MVDRVRQGIHFSGPDGLTTSTPTSHEMKTPKNYRAPLRSRQAITAWLLDRANNSRRNYAPFVYDVKLRHLNTDFEHAAKLARDSGSLPCDSERYLAECRALWDNGSSETAFECGTETACENVLEQDTNRMLWNGNKAVAEWEFAGRSGGWLVLKEFDGVTFSDALRHADLPEILAEQSCSWLRNLYRFLIQCDHDFRRPETEVEYQAAGWFFNNAVDRIKTDAELQAEESATKAEQAERAHWEARDTVTI
jgi:hypothetical protein